jgi:hypothetical protein
VTSPTNKGVIAAFASAASQLPKDARFAAALAEQAKHKSYTKDFPGNSEVKSTLRPFGVDAYGAWGPGAVDFLAEMVGEIEPDMQGRLPSEGMLKAARGRIKRQIVEAVASALAVGQAQHLHEAARQGSRSGIAGQAALAVLLAMPQEADV